MPVWAEVIGHLKQEQCFRSAMASVAARRNAGAEVYPPPHLVFAAFKLTSFDSLKAVILGQDPYHNPGEAMGLSFSVPPGIPIPPSLQNIYTELKQEYPDFQPPAHGCLIPWARQGVLLLNTILTVERGQAFAHRDFGWQQFTAMVISAINARSRPLVFMLWGSAARSISRSLDTKRHLVLTCAHPSPLSAYRGFFGCGHFTAANRFLKEHGRGEIDWQLPPVISPADLMELSL